MWSVSLSVLAADKRKTQKLRKPLIDLLNFAFIALAAIITLYTARHYIFTITALYPKNHTRSSSCSDKTVYEPMVSVLIPAPQRRTRYLSGFFKGMTELTYPKDKLEVIVIDDASTDQTAKNAKRFAEHHDFHTFCSTKP